MQILSGDPATPPRVDLNLLADERDVRRLAGGVRTLARVIEQAAFHLHPDDFFPATFSARVKMLSRLSRTNAVLTSVLGTLLDTPAPMRRWIIDRFMTRGTRMSTLMADERALDAFIRDNVFGVWHASGTCRMGPADDRSAVTDHEGRVHDVENLRVVDASLMPRLPSANTNIPTIMIAEKIADGINRRRTETLCAAGRKEECAADR